MGNLVLWAIMAGDAPVTSRRVLRSAAHQFCLADNVAYVGPLYFLAALRKADVFPRFRVFADAIELIIKHEGGHMLSMRHYHRNTMSLSHHRKLFMGRGAGDSIFTWGRSAMLMKNPLEEFTDARMDDRLSAFDKSIERA